MIQNAILKPQRGKWLDSTSLMFDNKYLKVLDKNAEVCRQHVNGAQGRIGQMTKTSDEQLTKY